MRIRNITAESMTIPAAGLTIESGAVAEIDDEIGWTLCLTDRFEAADDESRDRVRVLAERDARRQSAGEFRKKAVCGRCRRTLGDLVEHENGTVFLEPRLRGQRAKRATFGDGPVLHGVGRLGQPVSVRSVAAQIIVCRCGARPRLSVERAAQLLERARTLNLSEVVL